MHDLSPCYLANLSLPISPLQFNVPACEIDSREKAIWEEIDKSDGDIKVAEQTYQALSTAR